jgi:hypothetical protein
MLNLQQLLIQPFAKEVEKAYRQTYGMLEPEYANILVWTSQLALENIANTDALYHNVEHTIMVTLAGQEILKGKHLCDGGITPGDWLHFIIALLCHDIGYVKGICKNDRDGVYDTGVDRKTVKLPTEGTDAALAPYHVDRGKCFVIERFTGNLFQDIDAHLIASFIEMTRFPIPNDDSYNDTKDFRGLVRAADLIGQLGDPNYLRKIPALFYEFQETGTNEKMGYKTPADLRKGYAKFFWETVNPYIQDALRYLRVTQEGKQWITNLHSHIFTIEHNEV